MTILESIRAKKEDEVRNLRDAARTSDLEKAAFLAPSPVDVIRALQTTGRHVVAEVKRASPSRGDIDNALDPGAVASEYAEAGAAAISVLTDASFFKGSLDDFVKVRRSVDLPVLRKDFVIDELQILESRGLGADIVLLIVRMLSDRQLVSLREYAEGFGMTALVEVHTADEVRRALDTGARCIGVNNRDLDTFEVSLQTSLALRHDIPRGIVTVSESGVLVPEDADELFGAGYDAVLIGEGLVRSTDKRAFLERVRRG